MAKKQENNNKQAAGVSQQEFEKLQTEFDSLKELATQLDGQLKRAVADYHNLEKRVNEGRSELSSWATVELIKKILPVLSSFEMVIKGVSESERQSGWFRGVELAVKQLQQVLKDEGLEEIEADGQFDPALHEAVDTEEGEDGKILKVVQRGYTLNGKVVQPAKVVVGRKQE